MSDWLADSLFDAIVSFGVFSWAFSELTWLPSVAFRDEPSTAGMLFRVVSQPHSSRSSRNAMMIRRPSNTPNGKLSRGVGSFLSNFLVTCSGLRPQRNIMEGNTSENSLFGFPLMPTMSWLGNSNWNSIRFSTRNSAHPSEMVLTFKSKGYKGETEMSFAFERNQLLPIRCR